MGRRKQTVSELAATTVTDGKIHPLKWAWLDYSILPLPDFIELIGMPKGRFQSYLRRGVLSLNKFGSGGPGNHLRYTPREALKLLAIDRLARAGAWNECLYQTFRYNGVFDLILNGYQIGSYGVQKRPDPIFMNTEQDRLRIETGKSIPYANDAEYNVALLRGDWPPKEWAWVEFDVAGFWEWARPKVMDFLRQRGVEVR